MVEIGKHTPGPWGDETKSIITRGATFISHANYDTDADNRLRDAAPDLLFALKNLLAVKNGEGGTVFNSDDIARAAIAKATGQ